MREKYDVVDIAKLFFAMAIISLHVGHRTAFLDIFSQYIARLGVPFFFIVAGYFLYAKLEKGKNKAVITDYVKRVMKMWLVWLLLYMPIFAYQLLSQGNLLTTCLSFLHKTVCITPAYLWYLSALACGSVLMAVFFLKNEKAYLVASILLFIIGATGNTYILILDAEEMWGGYRSIFLTTRNGIFFAPVFVGIGAYLKKHEERIALMKYKKVLLFMACIAYGAEVFLVGQSDRIYEDRSFYFTLPLAAGCVAECILNFKVNISWAFACRRLSTWIYCSQFGFIIVWDMILYRAFGADRPSGEITWILTVLSAVIAYFVLNAGKWGRKLLKHLT